MKYGNLGEAMSFYNTSKQNIFKRGKNGSIPMDIIDGKKKYVLDEKYSPKLLSMTSQDKKKETLPKVEKVKKPKPPKDQPITTELYKEHFTIPKDILIEEVSNNLTDQDKIIKDLEIIYDLTDTDKGFLEDFITHYKAYKMLFDIANSDPVGIGYKPNPAFKEAREMYKMAMSIAEHIGIGKKNRDKLKVDTNTMEVNPFAEIMGL